MAADHQKFVDFDWTDERWQTYLNGLYPVPSQRQVLKFKKKWYKKNIDPEFDDTYEPPAISRGESGTSRGNDYGSHDPSAPYTQTVQGDGQRWTNMVPKATICFLAYAVALTISVAAVAGVFPAYQALIVLVGAFILEVLAKYGLKFNVTYLQSVLQDDVGIMPIMVLTLLTPGLHPVVRAVSLVPPFLTGLLSFSTICKVHPRLPAALRDFFAPLAGCSARYQILQKRADIEVGLGLILIVAVLCVKAAPISALLFWNFMMMRYMMSPWTQASFRKLDGILSPVLGSIPGISHAYEALTRFLFSFVDPTARKTSRCSIL